MHEQLFGKVHGRLCSAGAAQVTIFVQAGRSKAMRDYLPIWWGMAAKASSGGSFSSCCSVRRWRAPSSRGANTSQCLPRTTRPAAHMQGLHSLRCCVLA